MITRARLIAPCQSGHHGQGGTSIGVRHRDPHLFGLAANVASHRGNAVDSGRNESIDRFGIVEVLVYDADATVLVEARPSGSPMVVTFNPSMVAGTRHFIGARGRGRSLCATGPGKPSDDAANEYGQVRLLDDAGGEGAWRRARQGGDSTTSRWLAEELAVGRNARERLGGKRVQAHTTSSAKTV